MSKVAEKQFQPPVGAGDVLLDDFRPVHRRAIDYQEDGCKRHRPWSVQIDAKFPQYADFLDEAIGSANNRYMRMARWHMIWYRVAGTTKIVLSVSLPFILLIEFPSDSAIAQEIPLLISGISVAIALAAAIRVFWAWNEN